MKVPKRIGIKAFLSLAVGAAAGWEHAVLASEL